MLIRNIALIIAISSLLTGCNTQQTNAEQHALITEPTLDQHASIEQNPTVEVEKPKKIRRAKLTQQSDPQLEQATAVLADTETKPTVVTQQSAAAESVLNNWQPNEAHLARGSELINGLKRDLGGKQPSANEMQNRLQTHMGLSPIQALKVMAALGIH